VVDLVFSGAPLSGPPWDLVFNATHDGRVVARVVAGLGLPTVLVEADVAAGIVGAAVVCTLPGPQVSVAGIIDPALPDHLVARAGLGWSAAEAASLPVGASWPASALIRGPVLQLWQDAEKLQLRADSPWSYGAPLRRSGPRSIWRDADVVRARAGAPWLDLVALGRSGASSLWRDAVRLELHARSSWREALGVRPAVAVAWADGLRGNRVPWLTWRRGAAGNRPIREPWRDTVQLVWHGGHLPPIVIPPDPEPPCYTPSAHLLFAARVPFGTDLVFRCENHPPVPPALVIVPVKRFYAVLDSFLLKRVVDNVYLPALSASMSLDVDSWTWGMSVTLPLAELANVEADTDGTPVELEATVNGVAYRMLAERVQRARQFPSGGISVQCRGIGGGLDVLSGSYANASAARTAAQLMDDALTINGAGVGWSIDFGLEDWLVPAGAWAYQGTAIAALQAIAAAAGGYLQPHPTGKVLRVLPRYPELPWNWAGVTPDYELPSAVVTREASEWVEKPRYTRVFVSGQNQGVLCQVTRAGTDGSAVAPAVTDQLITVAAPGRQRGGAILADTGRQATVSLRMPVLAETGIIPPGKFVRYVDGTETRFGITRSVSVDIGAAGAGHRQTIGVETHA